VAQATGRASSLTSLVKNASQEVKPLSITEGSGQIYVWLNAPLPFAVRSCMEIGPNQPSMPSVKEVVDLDVVRKDPHASKRSFRALLNKEGDSSWHPGAELQKVPNRI